MRAVSTVLDVAVFLLLVSAAVGTVAYAPQPVESGVETGQTASILATTTASVEYELGSASRWSHGTVGTLLGRAAVANATLYGTPLMGLSGDFRDSVRHTARETLPNPNRTHVSAVWQPYPDAPLRGCITVGMPPPAGVDVAATTLTVPASVPATETESVARMAGYHGLAVHAARAVTTGLLPSTALDAAVGHSNPTAVASASRFRVFAAALDISTATPLSAGDISTARQRVTDALAVRFEADMRRQFDSFGDARAGLQTGTVTITVRRWER